MTTDGFGTAGFNALRRFAAMGAAALFLVSARVEADEAAPLIQTQAERAVILDYETGDVLFEKDARTAAPPASMSKLMTTEMLFQRLKDGSMTLDQELPVSERAWRKQGSKMWVLVNTSVPVEDLLRGIVVQSGNDACIVVAEAIGGTEDAFAEMMNERAAEIGLTDSTFANSTGWPDPNHKMSALDLARLSRHLIAEYPDYYPYFAEREFTWSDITQPNRNPLLFAGVGADGLKTGHTEESGYGLVGSAQVRGDRRIIVIGGLDSEAQRAGEARRLLSIAFNDFVTRNVVEAGDLFGEAEVWKGVAPSVPLMAKADLSQIMHRRAADETVYTVAYEGPLKAPVSTDTPVATLKVETPGRAAEELPLFAAKPVAELGVFGKLGLAVRNLVVSSSSGE